VAGVESSSPQPDGHSQADAALLVPESSTAATSLPAPETIDPENRLLWRQRLRRLESEVIRDSVLAVSGALDRQSGGPPILLEAQPDGMVVISDKGAPTPTSKWRRSVYLLARHQYHLSVLTVFDQPVLATNCTRRVTSAVPLQSLTMMNDALLFEQAEQFAARVSAMTGTASDQQITLAFRMALGRAPVTAEVYWCQELLSRQVDLYQAEKVSPPDAARKALVHLCRSLFNTSEFPYAP
jgi:hypothetical protein